MRFRPFFLYCLMLTLSPALCWANKDLMGNVYYSQGKYKDAIDNYQIFIKEGKQSAVLFYNLGNAYFKAGELPSAILYYEKARLLSPGDEDINFNIRFANAKTVDKIEEAPEFFLTKWWIGFILHYAADTLAVIAIIMVFIGSVLLIIYFFSTNTGIKKTSFFSAVTFLLMGLITVAMAQSQLGYFKNNKHAVVFASVANVKSSPAAQSATAFVLHEGAKVNLKETNGEYTRIKLPNGNEGWLKSSDIKKI